MAAFLSSAWFDQVSRTLSDAGPVPLEEGVELFRIVIELSDAPASGPQAMTFTMSRDGASLLAAVLSVLAFDFFFVPPYMSFAVTDFSHIVTFGVMFFVAIVISGLTKRIRDQADSARRGERRTASLYAVSRELGVAASREMLLEIAARHVREVFGAKVALLLPGHDGPLEIVLADEGTLGEGDNDRGVAD